MAILNHLKEATQTIHNNIEAQSLAHKIVDHSISFDEYVAHLKKQYHAYHSVEMALIKFCHEHASSSLCSIVNNQKSQYLQQDLKALNIKFENSSNPLKIHDLPTAVGSLYVIEGSMLGNMMISRHIKKCPALEHLDQFYFYNPSKAQAVERWNTFKSLVNELEFSDADLATSAIRAKTVFQLF